MDPKQLTMSTKLRMTSTPHVPGFSVCLARKSAAVGVNSNGGTPPTVYRLGSGTTRCMWHLGHVRWDSTVRRRALRWARTSADVTARVVQLPQQPAQEAMAVTINQPRLRMWNLIERCAHARLVSFAPKKNNCFSALEKPVCVRARNHAHTYS